MSDAAPPVNSPHAPTDAGTAKKPETRLQTAKTNLTFLARGSDAAVKPGSPATRGFLTTLRYVLRYTFRRLFRVAKYAAIGAVITTLSLGALGTLGTGIAWLAAPGIGSGMVLGAGWWLVKFGWRHRPDRFRGGWWSEMAERASQGRDPASDEAADMEVVREAARKEENRRARREVWARTELEF